MKNTLSKILIGLFFASSISACSTQNITELPNQNNNIQANSELSNKYIVTAYAIVDSYSKAKSSQQRAKLKKDFESEINKVNRFSVEKILKYTAKKLQENLKPGQDPKTAPLIDLIDTSLMRSLELTTRNFMPLYSSLLFIADEKDINRKNKLLQKFDKDINQTKVAKADAKLVLQIFTDSNSDDSDYIDPKSEIGKRILASINKKLNS